MNKSKKEGTLEGVLFFGSFVLLIVTGYLFLKREDNDYKKLINELSDIKGSVSELETKANAPKVISPDLVSQIVERLDMVEIKLIEAEKRPPVMNVVIDKPIKVLTKQLKPKSTLPGLTPTLKKQVRELSQ